MAKPVQFKARGDAASFRMGANHVPWRNLDRFRGQSGAGAFRGGSGKKKGGGKPGGS